MIIELVMRKSLDKQPISANAMTLNSMTWYGGDMHQVFPI
jgi:hypothetical protein